MESENFGLVPELENNLVESGRLAGPRPPLLKDPTEILATTKQQCFSTACDRLMFWAHR